MELLHGYVQNFDFCAPIYINYVFVLYFVSGYCLLISGVDVLIKQSDVHNIVYKANMKALSDKRTQRRYVAYEGPKRYRYCRGGRRNPHSASFWQPELSKEFIRRHH